MSFPTSSFIQYEIYSDGDAASVEQNQLLEVRSNFIHRLIFGSPNAEPPHQILHETAPVPLGNALFPLHLHYLLRVPVFFQVTVEHFLSFLNIHAHPREAIAMQIVSCVLEMAAGNREMNFHIVAVVDCVQLTWMEPIPELYPVPVWLGGISMEEGTVVPEEAPAAMKKVRVERLEEIGEEEELEACSICLDEFNCKDKEREVVKIPCGHMYHESCILNWVNVSISCPLCRATVPLEDSE